MITRYDQYMQHFINLTTSASTKLKRVLSTEINLSL